MYSRQIVRLTNQQIEAVDFFHDFIIFLRYLESQPIKRTATGNISLRDITNFEKLFRQRKVFDEYKKFGWKITTETNIQPLHQIRVICEVMNLVYKRKGKFLVTKNGRAYLDNIDSVAQYWNMVLYFWERVNWAYFSPGMYVYEKPLAEFLQENQEVIWQLLLKTGKKWIEYASFCKALSLYFHLEQFYKGNYMSLRDLYMDIEYGLFFRNLERFGCVEVERKKGKYQLDRISRFRPTQLGLFMFQKALHDTVL